MKEKNDYKNARAKELLCKLLSNKMDFFTYGILLRSMVIFLFLLFFNNVAFSNIGSNIEADVVIFESTPSGILASIAAANDGHDVIMITAYRHVGGMRTSGLSMPNLGVRGTLGGLGKEFHDRVHQYYINKYGADSEQVRASDGGFKFEPHVAEKVFLDWLLDAGVEIMSEEYITSVQKEDAKIISVQTNRNRRIKATVFIDASYEGDLLAMANISYRVGRESRDKYGESLAGITYPPEKVGQASNKIQRYVYRLVLTDIPENQVSFQKPDNYHRAMYMIDAAHFQSNSPTSLDDVFSLNIIPNRKTDVRVGEGWVGGSHAWPEASFKEREFIAKEHRDYAQGYLWFLLNDDSVPKKVQRELAKWGYAKDEFVDNDHWPYQIYVREARRLVGDYVMTEHDILENRFKSDGVAIGSYMLDVHPIQYVSLPDEEGGLYSKAGVVREGGIAYPIQPYEIPYRSMLPKRTEAENLLVSICISSSHVAYSSIRMEPVYMMLGHAAGLAASMSLNQGTNIHELDTNGLKSRLVEQKAVIDAKPFQK